MLLLTMEEWHGPSRLALNKPAQDRLKAETSLVGLVTKLPLLTALRRVRLYQDAFKTVYEATSAVEYRLLAVSTIDDLDDEGIELAGVMLVEDLKQDIAEWVSG